MNHDAPAITPPWVVRSSVPIQERDPIPKRKRRFRVFSELADQGESDALANELARKYIPELQGCSTGEMAARPIPHAFAEQTTQMRACYDLLKRRLPETLAWLARRARIKDQAFDVRGRIGFPEFKTTPRKLQTLRPYWDRIVAGDESFLRGQFATCNVRNQPEARDKRRVFQFIDRHGVPYEKEVGPVQRAYLDGWLAMRTRIVCGYGVANPLTQLVDSLLHDAELTLDICHFTRLVGFTIPAKYYVAADVKHFERQIGGLVGLWADCIGGNYQRLMRDMLSAPFMVPTDDWSQAVTIHLKSGATAQLGSGLSPVTDLAKALFIVVFAELDHREGGKTFQEALEALATNKGYVGIMMYGDDNLYYSDSKARLDRMFEWVGRFVTLEEEVPPAFLGHAVDEDRVMRMRARSYYANFYWPERPPGSIFRPYPNFGFVMRRQLYLRDGQKKVREMVEFEDQVLRKYGVPYSDIAKRAAREGVILAGLPDAYLLGREHVLTTEQKLKLPDYQVLPAAEVRPYVKYLLKDGPLGDLIE